MTFVDDALDWFGRWLARHLRREIPGDEPFVPADPQALRRALEPGDVLLIAGSSKLSTAIKYLTQSTWSHATLYVGPQGEEMHALVEVNPVDGCVAVPLTRYERFHTRICRPVGLTDSDRAAVIGFVLSRLGTQYDMRNIFDLARFLLSLFDDLLGLLFGLVNHRRG